MQFMVARKCRWKTLKTNMHVCEPVCLLPKLVGSYEAVLLCIILVSISELGFNWRMYILSINKTIRQVNDKSLDRKLQRRRL